MIRGFENNLDEMKAIDYLDSLDKRILMTREEGKLTQLVIDYKKIINKAIETLHLYTELFDTKKLVDFQKEMSSILENKEVEDE